MSTEKKNNKDSLRFRIILLLIMSVCVLVITIFFSCFMIVKYNRAQYDKRLGQEFSELHNELMQKQYGIQSYMTALSYEQSIQRILGDTGASSYEIMSPIYDMEQNILRLLYSYSLLDPDIYNVHLIDEHGKRYIYLNYSDSQQIDTFIEENKECTQTMVSDLFILGGEQCFAVIEPIRKVLSSFDNAELPKNIIGHIIFTIDGRFLKERLKQTGGGDGEAFLLDREGRIMMSSDEESHLKKQVIHAVCQKKAVQPYSVEKCGGYVISRGQVNENGWSIALVSKNTRRDFYDTNPLVFLGVSWFLVLSIISCSVFRLLHNINSFLYKLLHHMDHIGKGNWKSKIEPDHLEEFKRIDDGLNEMMEKVVVLSEQNVELSTEIYKKEKEQIQNTLLALQSQMNPHFLYNTMECIKNIGICYGVKEIEALSGALSDILKYSLRKDHVVTVEEEMNCIRNYMLIQSIRFEDRYRVIYHVDETLLKLKIMRLSLEPLVENAIKHGFEKKKTNCIVEVSLFQDCSRIHMVISDNGAGMSEEMIQMVMMYEESNGEGVALKNLFRRLKLFYQDAVRFQIESGENEGTSVSMIIDTCFYDEVQSSILI